MCARLYSTTLSARSIFFIEFRLQPGLLRRVHLICWSSRLRLRLLYYSIPLALEAKPAIFPPFVFRRSVLGLVNSAYFLWRAPPFLETDFACNMAKVTRSRRRLSSRQLRSTPYPIPQSSYRWETPDEGNFKRTLALERKDWVDATCSVCMEFPHNAVLLLCSSHEKGCRPYMCGTSYRHSNCLDQFKKAYTKVRSAEHDSLGDNTNNLGLVGPAWPLSGKSDVLELACPLCRGQVKGWTVVEPARKYLNNKKRNCMQDDCSFVGTYKELKKHVKSEHPCAKPREVDPEMEEKWRVLEDEREGQDVISAIRSSMPRSVVFGDYVIEMTNSDIDSEDDVGAGDGEFAVAGGNPGIRSILYLFLREGVRLMRLQRDHDALEGREDGGVYDHHILGAGDDADIPAVSAAYSSGGDDSIATDFSRGSDMGMLTPDRRRRRRRRRSRGSSALDIS